ncbi:hypothetical protein ACWEVO_11830, partial [Micromonospora sp. NPDC003776]
MAKPSANKPSADGPSAAPPGADAQPTGPKKRSGVKKATAPVKKATPAPKKATAAGRKRNSQPAAETVRAPGEAEHIPPTGPLASGASSDPAATAAAVPSEPAGPVNTA